MGDLAGGDVDPTRQAGIAGAFALAGGAVEITQLLTLPAPARGNRRSSEAARAGSRGFRSWVLGELDALIADLREACTLVGLMALRQRL